MSIYLDKVQKVIGEFEGEDNKKLVEYYCRVAREILLDEREVKKAKVELLGDLCTIDASRADQWIEDVLNHKILQIRALVLDLVDNDYGGDCGAVRRPEKWIRQIVTDAKETFNASSEFGRDLFVAYNKKLLEEFCRIFVSKNCKFGVGGNQLLVNFHYYARFAAGRADLDFRGFFGEMTSHFKDGCLKPTEELRKILGEE